MVSGKECPHQMAEECLLHAGQKAGKSLPFPQNLNTSNIQFKISSVEAVSYKKDSLSFLTVILRALS
jgi:hypothetical protein